MSGASGRRDLFLLSASSRLLTTQTYQSDVDTLTTLRHDDEVFATEQGGVDMAVSDREKRGVRGMSA
jgi:hypothetical protein